MAQICDRCGKGTLRGHQVSFSGKRSLKVFRPNLHFAWVIEGGRRMRRKFCTKCLRIVKGKVSPIRLAPLAQGKKAKQTETLGTPQQIVAS
ncbi:MAG: bL28 family ribosomal protein [bacterium]|nr:bL28 family ribosomal protein [bacterium]